MKAFTIIAVFSGGYVAAVFTWDHVHALIIGVGAKAEQLRNRARALEASLRAKL